MSKRTKIWLIAGASLTLLGIIAFVGAMSFMKWDFKKLSTKDYVTNTYDITEKYKGISVITDTADVELIPAEDGKTRVVCYEESKAKHSVSVNKSGVIEVKIKNDRPWYDYLGIGAENAKISIYLPAGEYNSLRVNGETGDVKIPKSFAFESLSVFCSTGKVESCATVTGAMKVHLTTGDIYVSDARAGSIEISVSTGRINISRVDCGGAADIVVSTGKTALKDFSCGRLYSKGSTGDVRLENVVSAGRISIERSTGDIEFERSDAAELFLKTSTGDVEGTLRSPKVFVYKTDSGEVDLPRSSTGGICDIETKSGDIEIKILGK